MAAEIGGVGGEDRCADPLVVAETEQGSRQQQFADRFVPGSDGVQIAHVLRGVRPGCFQRIVDMPRHPRLGQQAGQFGSSGRVAEPLQGHGHRAMVREVGFRVEQPDLVQDRRHRVRVPNPAERHDGRIQRTERRSEVAHARVPPADVPLLGSPDAFDQRFGAGCVAKHGQHLCVGKTIVAFARRVGFPQQRQRGLGVLEDHRGGPEFLA